MPWPMAINSTPEEKAHMLMELAMGIQQQPKTVDELKIAIDLYDEAARFCPEAMPLFHAQIMARKATALMAYPDSHGQMLAEAREVMADALAVLNQRGSKEEIAEAEMNLGLILQNLAGLNKAPITDAISAYQRALRVFDAQKFPVEFAILQNNLATAFLSIPFTDQRAKMREALAVQAFEEGLKIVTLIDHPNEYAMLQNNLGNALQYVSSSHNLANCYRAVEAYDEALKVRNRQNMPGAYANTIANKANCLITLPDNPELPEMGNADNLGKALALYEEAIEIFRQLGEWDKIQALQDILNDHASAQHDNDGKNEHGSDTFLQPEKL